MRDLQNKRALITGAASGIGRALALRMAKEGTHLYLADVDGNGLKTIAHDVRTLGVDVLTRQGDLSQANEVSGLVDNVVLEWGGIDLLVNNAGICYYGATKRMTWEQWDKLMNINLLTPIRLVHAFIPVFLARPEAHVVNIASIFGIVATARCCAYHTSKFGLVGLTESLRAELGAQGIGVTAVCPGFVRTRLFDNTSCGREEKRRTPPNWLSITPERVAECTVRGIKKNKRLVLASWHGHFLHFMKRLSPGLIDWIQRFGWRRKYRQRMDRIAKAESEAIEERREAA